MVEAALGDLAFVDYDYLLNNVPALHNWKDDDNDVLDLLTVEIQDWYKQKGLL